MSNPYRIEGPALISFSGGRTSGYMLWHVLDAYEGKLPDDVHVTFANTGKEREETLRFVHECGTRWGVDIVWLEYRRRERGEPHANGFEVVGYNSASRQGEPFERVLAVKGYLPNAVSRFCSIELKVRIMENYCRSLGWDRWNSAVGLRADEMMRVFRAIDANENRNDRWTTVMPMATAKVRQEDVDAWWRRQDFDLQLKPHEGNCDLCFLKRRGKLLRLIRDNPGMADWWMAQEAKVGASRDSGNRFHMDRTFAELVREVETSPLLPIFDNDEEHDVECGLWCSGEEAA